MSFSWLQHINPKYWINGFLILKTKNIWIDFEMLDVSWRDIMFLKTFNLIIIEWSADLYADLISFEKDMRRMYKIKWQPTQIHF